MAGSTSAMAALSQAKEIEGVSLMTAAAGVALRAEYDNMYNTKYILSDKEILEIYQMTGYLVRPEAKEVRPSCHWQLSVMRDMLRKSFLKFAKPETTRLKTLVVGAAHREIARYWKNDAVDFYIYGKEGKDVNRILLKMLSDVRDDIQKRVAPPESGEVPPHKRRGKMILRDLEDIASAYAAVRGGTVAGGRRIYLEIPDKKYDQIIVEDAHYNLRDHAWLDLFGTTGASTAWVLGLLPFERLFENAPAHPVYEVVREHKAGDLGIMQIAAVGATALAASGTWTGDSLKWGAGVLSMAVLTALYGKRKYDYDEFVDTLLRFLQRFTGVARSRYGYDWDQRCTYAVQKMWEEFSRQLGHTDLIVTYRGGHSNGYIHDEDAMMTLLLKPWMGSVRWNFALQSEIVQRVGPMSIVQLTRTMVSETVVRTLSLPQNEQYVQVLDLIGSYDFVNEKEKDSPVYITLYYREYWDVFNFLRSQKDEVITVQLAMTMIRRASAGLSLGGSEVAPAWREDDEVLHRVAVTICVLALECVDETDFVMTPAVKKRLQDKSSRWDRFVKTLLVVGVCLVSAGLVIPIFELYRYFSAKRLKNPLMKPGVSAVKQRAGGPAWAQMAERFGMPARGAGFELDVEIAHNTGWDKTIEECCDFIPMLGDVGMQDPVCMHARAAGPSTVDLSMDRNKIAEFRVHLVESRDGATNDGLARVLDEFINLLDKDRNGYNYSAEFEMVRGPPGVGKSYTMRKFMKMLMASGKGVAVHSPFSKLSADYSVPDGSDDPFKFYTTHKLYKVGKLDVMIVEEFTNMDERVLAYMAFKTGARKVVIIGDPKQTGLMPDEGERLFEPGGIVKLDQVREHILPKNFRSCAYTVALANAECGYALYACNDEIVVPEVRDFSELDLEKVSIKDIMCFSKATAREVQQEIGSENTVRRNQGQTHQQGTIIVLRDGDENLVKNDALFAVAVTRRKVGTPLIIYADSSEVRALMENRLRLHDAEFQANIMKLARPDYRAFYEKERTERFGPDEPPLPSSDNFHDLYAKFGPKREVETEGVAPWLQELFYDAWRSAEADIANEQDALVKYDAESQEWKTINRLKAKRKIEWCTLDPMRHHPYAAHKWTAKWPVALIEDYVRVVLASVQEGQVPIFILKRWLRENNVGWVLYDKKTKMVDASDPVDLTKVCYVGVLVKNHVRLPTDAEYKAMFAPREIQIFVKAHGYTHAGGQAVECRPYVYSPFSTVRDFELAHGVELYDCTGMAKLDGGLSMVSVAAGITPRIGPARTLGGIGLFGNDWVPVTRKRADMRTDYARVLLDEGDYSWGGMTSIERIDVIKEPLPLARETPGCQDGYLLGTEVDLTAGMTVRTNAVGAAVGATKRLRGLKVRKDPLLVPLDRKGRQRPLSEYVWALAGGHGNTQLNNPVEVLGSAQRYFVKPKGGRPSVEGRRHAAAMAKNLVRKHFERRSILSGPCIDAIQADFVKAALARSYDVRATGNELAGLSDRLVHFSNKVQFKAGRDPDPLAKQTKVGQGISAVSAEVNLRWGPLFRQAGHEYATRGKSYNVFDCYMTEQQLAAKVRGVFKPLPSCAEVVTSDANEFDSVQNWHSRHAESTFYSILLGRPGLFTEYMQRHREKYPVSAPGLLNGKVDEAKPSGAPDTLVGNTLVSDLYTEELIQGSGPVAMVKKGDDKSRRQYKQHVNLDVARKIGRYSPLTLKITHGDVQFCGKVMTKEGLFPNLVTLVRKALARGSKDYKSWAEYQISIRDKLLEIREAGLELTVAYTASALNMRVDQVWDCWAVFQSLAHISEKQWSLVAKRVERNMPTVKDASGRIRPFT